MELPQQQCISTLAKGNVYCCHSNKVITIYYNKSKIIHIFPQQQYTISMKSYSHGVAIATSCFTFNRMRFYCFAVTIDIFYHSNKGTITHLCNYTTKNSLPQHSKCIFLISILLTMESPQQQYDFILATKQQINTVP